MSLVKAGARYKNVHSMTMGEVAGNIVEVAVIGHTFRTMVIHVSIFLRDIIRHPVNAGFGTLSVLLVNNPHRANAANFLDRSLREHGLSSTQMTSLMLYILMLMTNGSLESSGRLANST